MLFLNYCFTFQDETWKKNINGFHFLNLSITKILYKINYLPNFFLKLVIQVH